MRALYMNIWNFLSFGSAKVKLSKRGLVLIEGENKDEPTARSNGAAKSGIVEAFVWCMQGITLRGLEGDEVINRKVGKNCRVAIEWKDRGKKWMVIRTRQDDQLKTSLNLYEDGTRVTGSTIADTQAMIDRLLGMTEKTFLSSVVFGQSNAYRFSSLTDKEQKEILDEALGIEAYANAGQHARDEVNTLKVNIDTVKRDYDEACVKVETLEGEVERYKKRTDSYEEEKQAKKDEIRAEVDKLHEKIKEEETEDETKLTGEQAAHTMNVKVAEKKLKTASADTVEIRQKLTATRTMRQSLDRMIEKNEKLHGDCPTCGQTIDEDHQSDVLKELRRQLKETKALEAEHQKLADAADENEAEWAKKLKRARAALEECNTRIANSQEAWRRIAGWKAKIAEKMDRYKELKEEHNPYKKLRREAEKKLEDAIGERHNLGEELSELERKLEHHEFWLDAFGAKGLRSLLIDSALPILNDKVARYAQAVSGGSLHIEFKTQTELKSGKTVDRFEVAVTNAHGADRYKGNSEGEKAKIDLCVGLALQALVASRARSAINVAFFDEPFESLDDAAIEYVATLLTEELRERESVFVITHNEALKSFFPNVLTVVKKGGMSHVE